MGEYLLRLPWPPSALSSNARGHYMVKARATKAARQAGWAIARAQGVKVPMPDADLFFTYHPPSYCGDPQNVPHMLKAYIDGIADAMGCDDKGFKVHYPPEFSEKTKGGAVVCRIKPNTVILPVKGVING